MLQELLRANRAFDPGYGEQSGFQLFNHASMALIARACRFHDEHDIEIVYSCIEEERVYGGPLYREAAARVVLDAENKKPA